VFVVLVDHVNAASAAAAFGDEGEESNALEYLTEVIDGPTRDTLAARRAQIEAVSAAYGGD
jgi:hypothetical protein